MYAAPSLRGVSVDIVCVFNIRWGLLGVACLLYLLNWLYTLRVEVVMHVNEVSNTTDYI